MMEITSIKYINMDKDIEKRFLIEKLLSKFQFTTQRISGIQYAKSPENHIKYLSHGVAPYIMDDSLARQHGAIGCWIAHVKALETIDASTGYTVVIEDDFVCKDDFFEKALAMLNEFNRDFDVIVFDPKGDGPASGHYISPGIYDAQGCSHPHYVGSHCLFYNNSRITNLIKTIHSSQIRDYDGYLLVNKLISSYIFYTGRSKSIYFYSDVDGKPQQNSFWNGMAEWINYICPWDSALN